MKMVKSLLLTGAAGLITVAGAHAADLPIKAKPVEYVKVCSMYGAGFYYIPGTDTCIKIGGYLRFEVDANAGGTFSPAVGPGGRADQHNWAFDRTSSELVTRQRMLWTYDVRTQTEYGTLRSYARTGIQWTTGDSVLVGSGAQGYLDRAFIQFAGFTFGKGASFYELVRVRPALVSVESDRIRRHSGQWYAAAPPTPSSSATASRRVSL